MRNIMDFCKLLPHNADYVVNILRCDVDLWH